MRLVDKGIKPSQAIDYSVATLAAAKEFNISCKWYSALLYRENLWKANGTDGRGSYGISQMQVQTAKDVARELHESQSIITPQWMEDHPLTMIRYGARHFKDLLWEFRGPNKYYWATRAYNCGGTRIHLAIQGSKRWHNISEKYWEDINREYWDSLHRESGKQ